MRGFPHRVFNDSDGTDVQIQPDSLGRISKNAGSFIMMKRFFVILISCLWLAVPLFAQSNKLIRELESKRGALQKQIAESESILKDTKKDVGSQLNSLACVDRTD